MDKLTNEERDTLNAAFEILDRCTAQGSSWSISGNRFSSHPFGYDLTYFDSNEGPDRGQHMWVKGDTLADKIQTMLDIEANASANAEANRAARIKALREELAKLGEAA